jgi:uncharacterized protein YbaR (Trm112 family)
MFADRRKSAGFDPEIVNQLACPVCLGALHLDEARLVCVDCGRSYPIVDGIPVLIAERAVSCRSE